MKPDYPTLKILGLKLHEVDQEAVHAFILETVQSQRKAVVLNLNIHCICLALKEKWLADFINRAPLIFCDGDGVRWGLKILGKPVPPKITYDRWIWQVSKFAAEKGLSFYFLGGKPGVAQAAAERLQAAYPQLKILGTQHGYFDFYSLENEKIVERINQLKPDILILGLGMPLQERWLMENAEKLNVRIFLTGGAVFDYASGNFKRAPAWMISAHLEWLFRVLYDPRRLFTRYALEIPYFFYKVFIQYLNRKKESV